MIVIAAVVALTLFLINTEWGKNKIIGIANEHSPVKIRLESLALNVFKGRIELKGLEVIDAENVRMGRIGYIGAGVQYKPMFSGKYVVDSLIIGDLDVDVSAKQLEAFNSNKSVEEKAKPDTSKTRFDLIVENFEIKGLSAKYKDEEKKSEYLVQNTKIKAKADIKKKEYSLNMTGTEIKVNSGEINKTIFNENLYVTLKNSELEIKPANIKTAGLDVSLYGNIYELFTVPVFDIKLSMKLENSKLFDRSFILSKDSGKFSISAAVKGELDYPELDISVKHPTGIIYGQQVNSLYLTAKYKNKLLDLKTELLKGGNEKFDIDGILDLSAVFENGLISSKPEFEKTVYDLKINAEKFSLSNIPDMPDIRLDCGLNLKGKGIKPEDIRAKVVLNTDLSPFKFKEFSLSSKAKIKADINWEKGTFVSFVDLKTGKLKWQDYKFSGIDVIASMNDKGSVDVKKLDLRMDSSFVILKGKSNLFDKNWKLLKDPKIDIYLVGSNIRSKLFYPDIDTKINFKIDAKGKMNSLSGNYGLSTTGINYSGVEIEKVSVKGTFAGKDIILDSLSITGGGSNIIADGRITDLKTFKSRVRTESLKVDSLYPQIKELFKGDLSLDIEAGGDIKNPAVKGKVSLKNSTVNDTNLPELKLEIGYENSIADIYADLGFGINAKADLKSKEYSFVTKFENWDYSYLIPDNKNDFLTGIISGRIEGKGNLDKLKDYDIIVRLDSLDLNMEKKKIISGNDLTADFSQEELRLKNFNLKFLNDGFIDIKGYFKPGKDMDFKADIVLPVRSLAFVQEELAAADGYLKGNIRINGMMPEPVITGKMELDKIGIDLPVTEQKLYGLGGEIIFDKNMITINTVSGKIGNGTLALKGKIDIEKNLISNMNMNFKTTALPVSIPDQLECMLNSDLNYSGNLKAGKLKGDVLIIEALYYKNIDIFGSVFKGGGTKIVKNETKNDSLPDIALDLTLKSRRSLVFDNNFAFLELNPDLQIKGNISSPLISGRAKIEKDGFIIFQKNTFTINKGILDFEPVYGMLPTVDIQSETKVNDYKIFLSISENLANPKFSLTSVPSESDADILSILIFGRKSNEFLSGTNGTSVSKEKLIAEWLYKNYQKDLTKKTGLDYLQLSLPDNFSTKEPTGYGLTVGKRISDRLILKYSMTNNSSELIQKAIADYQIFETIIFSGFQSTDGNFGSELQYILEFR